MSGTAGSEVQVKACDGGVCNAAKRASERASGGTKPKGLSKLAREKDAK